MVATFEELRKKPATSFEELRRPKLDKELAEMLFPFVRKPVIPQPLNDIIDRAFNPEEEKMRLLNTMYFADKYKAKPNIVYHHVQDIAKHNWGEDLTNAQIYERIGQEIFAEKQKKFQDNLMPISLFGNAVKRSLAEKPAAAIRGLQAYTPGEALGFDWLLRKTSDYLEGLPSDETVEMVDVAASGKLWPVEKGEAWYKIDPKKLPEVINAWAATVGDQIPIMLMTWAGRVAGRVTGKPIGLIVGGAEALVTAGPDPTDVVAAPIIAKATATIVEHLSGAAPLIAMEAGYFMDRADELGVDKDIRDKYARLYGLGSGTIEYAQWLWNLRAFSGFTRNAQRSIIKKVLYEVGGGVWEGLEELSQQGLENFLIGKAIEAQKARTPGYDAEIPETWAEGKRAFGIGLGVSMITRMPGHAYSSIRKSKIAKQIQERTDSTLEEAELAVEAMAEGVFTPEQAKKAIEESVKEEEKAEEPKAVAPTEIESLAKELEESLNLSPERALEVAAKKLAYDEQKAAEVAEKPPAEPKVTEKPEITPPVEAVEAEKARKPLKIPEVTAKKAQEPEIAPVEPTKAVEEEPPERQISKAKRAALVRQVTKSIREHEIYQIEVEGYEEETREIGPGFYYVPPNLKTEVTEAAAGNKKVLSMFTFEPGGIATSWAKAAQERGIEDIGITEFVERVKYAVEHETKGAINEKLLEKAVQSGEPRIELLAMKYEALKAGLTPDEVNDTIEQWIQDHPDIDRALVEPEFVKVKEEDYVKGKQEFLRKVEKKGRQVKARLGPEEATIKRAKDRATKEKEVVFVYEKDGKYVVSKTPPKNIPYTKISPPKGKKITTTVERIGPSAEEVSTKGQKDRAYIVAKDLKLLSEKGKPKPQYRRLAKGMTGQTSMTMMTQEQADTFIEALEALSLRPGGLAPKIPTTTDIITKDLADKINEFKDIGFLEKFRPAWRVFEKIGLINEVFEPAFTAEIKSMEELFAFREKVTQLRDTVSADEKTAAKLFREIENPGTQKLTESEQSVVKWATKYFDDWANRLNLPVEKRRKNYITHIFEESISKDLKAKYPLDPDLVRALDFITPKTIFNPFLQERLGKKIGLKENIWSALEAYENKALKKFYYEPLIRRIRVYQKFLPPNSARYLRNYITRITGRPLVIDREINQTLKEMAAEIQTMPGGEQLAEYLTRGNAAGMLAYNMTGIYYECWLGLRPASAIKNLSQHGLILCETGPTALMKAMTVSGKERAGILAKSKVLKGRKSGFLPGIDQTYIKQLENKRRAVGMFMFKKADRKNVSDAFLAGYYEAKEKGLSEDWGLKRGDEVAKRTQYLYTKFAGSQFSQTAPGRVLGVLTTWPMNWAELMNDWIQGKASNVYSAYEKKTGTKVVPTNWMARRRALWSYLALVSLAMLIHKKTPFKALYYTGWTSIKMLYDLAAGKLAGLTIPRIAANLVVGTLLLDKKRLKAAWTEMKNFVVIVRELKSILEGEKDWINLFIYWEKEKKKKRTVTKVRRR